ncbi:MAG TPA: hypothetical protein IAD08_03610 [Candidatus Scatovivens faecipullorum]|nr:hypothetical protein [Candidatus Scatovivens faecipullorum]
MENAAKALELAAGVLLGVMLMALISYFFSHVGEWPQQDDEIATQEQLAKFNLEYEVYDKKGMYGVDVISCLNKAKSNNEKYAEGNRFLSGAAYGEQYYIDVCVNINSPLEEKLEVRYYDKNQKEVVAYDDDAPLVDGKELTMNDVGLFAGLDMSKDNNYTSFRITSPLKTTTVVLDASKDNRYMEANSGSEIYPKEGEEQKKYYSLMKDTQLESLLNFSNFLTIKVDNNTGENLEYWSSATWQTALYNFKTKRFKCDFIGYSEVTGRVNEIYFSELEE